MYKKPPISYFIISDVSSFHVSCRNIYLAKKGSFIKTIDKLKQQNQSIFYLLFLPVLNSSAASI